MLNKKQILDVDFIGGQGSLTVAEEKALSEYFKRKKVKSAKTKPAIRNRTKSEKKYSTV